MDVTLGTHCHEQEESGSMLFRVDAGQKLSESQTKREGARVGLNLCLLHKHMVRQHQNSMR